SWDSRNIPSLQYRSKLSVACVTSRYSSRSTLPSTPLLVQVFLATLPFLSCQVFSLASYRLPAPHCDRLLNSSTFNYRITSMRARLVLSIYWSGRTSTTTNSCSLSKQATSPEKVSLSWKHVSDGFCKDHPEAVAHRTSTPTV